MFTHLIIIAASLAQAAASEQAPAPAKAQPAAPAQAPAPAKAQPAAPAGALDLSDLTDEQRWTFARIAADLIPYAGCDESLIKCLSKPKPDRHVLREGMLVKALLKDSVPDLVITAGLERYYDSFTKREQPKVNNCAVLGAAGAPITIVEYSDFECSHCAAAVKPLHDVVTGTSKGKARLCSKYFPWPAHPRARIAAACAEYARSKGKFWQLSDLLFAHQQALEDAQLKDYAKQVGLDGDEMLKQVYAGKFDAPVEAHIREGTALGVQMTPTLYFNGREYALPVRAPYLQISVEDELEWQQHKAFGR
jgi:protein-disulfide isomerase